MEICEKTIYKSYDGKLFESEEECKSHETTLSSLRVFKVRAGSDAVEGKYVCNETFYIAYAYPVDDEYKVMPTLEAICCERFGNRFTFVSGVKDIYNVIKMWEIVGVMDNNSLQYPTNFIGSCNEKGIIKMESVTLNSFSEIIDYIEK